MANFFKSIEQGTGSFEKTLTVNSGAVVSGTSMKLTKVDRLDTTGRYFANLFSSFNLPITTTQQNKFTSGIYSGTAFQYLNKNRLIVVEFPKNSYGELIDGKSIHINLPVHSGASSAHTIVHCYSTFFDSLQLRTIGNALYSDPHFESSEFGVKYNPNLELPGQSDTQTKYSGYSSNVAYLYSNEIYAPQNDTTKSWATNNGKFLNQIGFTGTKYPAIYANNGAFAADQPVGIAYLDKGFAIITEGKIVDNLIYTAATTSGGGVNTGGTSAFTQIYFTASTSGNTTFDYVTTEFVQHITCLALPNEFYTSQNQTFLEKYGTNVTNQTATEITEIGLYNSKKELIALVKPSETLLKTKSNLLSFAIQIRI